MKISHFLTLLYLPLFSIICNENNSQITELAEPLNCVYPSDLELDSRTSDAMSKYKQPSLKDKIISNQ